VGSTADLAGICPCLCWRCRAGETVWVVAVSASPRIIAEGKTPEQWVAVFRSAGVEISARTLRERARALGACRVLGNAMMLLPEHIDLIFGEPECRKTDRSANTNEVASGGSKAVDLITTNISERALAHLTKPSRKPRSMKSTGQRGRVVSLDRTRQSPRTS